MVLSIREVETAIGSSQKKVTKSELNNRIVVRKSIVAKKSIDIGDRFSLSNLTTMRPGVGMSPVKLPKLLNKKSKKKYEAGDFIWKKRSVLLLAQEPSTVF